MPRTARPAAPQVFAPATLGPLTLRNRIIKAATFEGVMPGGQVSDQLVDFHRRVAAGGAAMSTVAYLAVSPEGRTDRHCLLLDEATVPGLRRLTDAVHAEGAAVAAQIGHAGPVANARSNGAPALSPSGGFTPMGSRLHAVDAGRDRAHHRGLPARRRAGGRRRLRLHRGPRRPQLPAERVLEPQAQPPRRPVRRLGGEPRPLRPQCAAHRARRRGPRDRRDGQAQHGRRRRRWALARRQRRGRPALRVRRRARCAGAHGGQLARQPHVPLPRRRAAPGVRGHAPAGRPARLPRRRPPLPQVLPLRGGLLPPLRRGSSSARCPRRSSSSAASASWRRSSRRWPRASRSSPWPVPCCASPTCRTACRQARRPRPCASTATSACPPSTRGRAASW